MKILSEKIFSPPVIFKLFLSVFLIFPKISTWLLVILFVSWIIENNWKKRVRNLIKNKNTLILPALYLLYVIAIFYSQNLEYALSKLETKLGLLLFPILFSNFSSLHLKEKKAEYQKVYVWSVFVLSLVCVIRALIMFTYELYCREHRIILSEYPYTNYFFSSYLSFFMHYGYFAMYVNVAIIFLYELYLKNFFKSKIVFGLLILVLSVFVLFLSSKAAIFSMFLIHIIIALYHLVFLKFSFKSMIYYLFAFVISFVVLVFIIPDTRSRVDIIKQISIEKKLDPHSVESTQLRAFAWKASLSLIKKNWLLGYGTGDVNDVLLNEYAEKGYYGALNKQINAHNQFFQTTLSTGIIGLILLLLFFVNYFYLSIKLKNIFMFSFILISFIAFLFESYLETQAGVFYFSILSFIFYQRE